MSPLRACSAAFRTLLCAAPCALGVPAHAAPVDTPDQSAWPRWQGRVGLASPVAGSASALGPADRLGTRSSLSLLGDYYFTQSGLAASAARDAHGGGFRATGGLFVGPRSGLWLAQPTSLSTLSAGLVTQRRGFELLSPAAPSAADSFDGSSVPYVGVGYTGLRSLRATGGGWGFSADLGLVGLRPRSLVRLGPQAVNDGVSELQLSPLLQVGVSYSF